MLSIVMLSFVYAEHINKAQHAADCRYGKSRVIILNVVMPGIIIMLSVVMLSAVHA
jgi:hypothetical protein